MKNNHGFRASMILAATCAVATLYTAAPSVADEVTAPSGYQLVGTWKHTVEWVNCETGAPLRTPYSSLNTFYADGNASEIGFGVSGAIRSGSHGRWVRTGKRTFANNFELGIFDPNGIYIGYQIFERMLEVSVDGQRLTARGRFVRYGLSDEITFSGCANEAGIRQPEPTPF